MRHTLHTILAAMVLVLLTIACGKSATDPSPGGKAGSGGIPGTLTGARGTH